MKNRSKNLMRSEDKNALVIVGTLIFMLALIALFYHGVRYVPLMWMAWAIIALDAAFVKPSVYRMYYQLYNGDAGFSRFLPYYNVIGLFPGSIAILSVVVTVITIVTCLTAFGPAILVTKSNAVTMMNLSYNAVGAVIIELAVLSALFGFGYSHVMHDVRQMRQELTQAKVSAVEIVYYVFLFVPFLRTFGILHLYNSMAMLLRNGYSVGKDFGSVEIYEEYDDSEYGEY